MEDTERKWGGEASLGAPPIVGGVTAGQVNFSILSVIFKVSPVGIFFFLNFCLGCLFKYSCSLIIKILKCYILVITLDYG